MSERILIEERQRYLNEFIQDEAYSTDTSSYLETGTKISPKTLMKLINICMARLNRDLLKGDITRKKDRQVRLSGMIEVSPKDHTHYHFIMKLPFELLIRKNDIFNQLSNQWKFVGLNKYYCWNKYLNIFQNKKLTRFKLTRRPVKVENDQIKNVGYAYKKFGNWDNPNFFTSG